MIGAMTQMLFRWIFRQTAIGRKKSSEVTLEELITQFNSEQ